MAKFQNKYRIESARLKGYNYASAGFYFITICTENREHYFGEIKNGNMQLSNIGVLADVFWHEIKNHSKNIKLHEFVVMPNHVHGILEIVDGGDDGNTNNNSNTNDDTNTNDDSITNGDIKTNDDTNKTIPEKNQQMSKISPKSGSIGRIIGSYKGAVTKHCNRLGFEFGWQSRFNDHIIRNNKSLNKIQNYIKNNPRNWKEDKFFN